jgi:hypothetical protein
MNIFEKLIGSLRFVFSFKNRNRRISNQASFKDSANNIIKQFSGNLNIKNMTVTSNEKVDNAQIPYVDVGVIFHKEFNSTRFQFIQKSKIPALVWLDINLKINGIKIDSEERKKWLDEDERLFGIGSWKVRLDNRATSAWALKKITNKVMESEEGRAELFIEVFTAPIFREDLRSLYEKKHYVFSKGNPKWVEVGWGIEDRLHSGFEFPKD